MTKPEGSDEFTPPPLALSKGLNHNLQTRRPQKINTIESIIIIVVVIFIYMFFIFFILMFSGSELHVYVYRGGQSEDKIANKKG